MSDDSPTGTNDLDEITQQWLIEIPDGHAVHAGDSVEDWGFLRSSLCPTARSLRSEYSKRYGDL